MDQLIFEKEQCTALITKFSRTIEYEAKGYVYQSTSTNSEKLKNKTIEGCRKNFSKINNCTLRNIVKLSQFPHAFLTLYSIFGVQPSLSYHPPDSARLCLRSKNHHLQ